MSRRGRFLELRTNRTPEQQRELNRRMREARPEILATIEQKTAELLAIVHKYTSLDLVANLLLRDIFHNPDTYVESESELRPHWVEHATVLELRDAAYEVRGPVLVDVRDVERAHGLLEDIFMQTTWYYLAEAGDPDKPGPPSRIDELRFSTLLHGMSVRSPAYSSHWRDVLLGLFKRGSAVEHLAATCKLDIETALAVVDAIEQHLVDGTQARVHKAKIAFKDFHKRLQEYKASGSVARPMRRKFSTGSGTCVQRRPNGT
jgi:hypothetical protein